ncbi:P-loop containing nucleoside triphosphate hydrolase superfamily protein [Hordeum vulgare]|nr:P-loop containing nucleoside triphosphate hydrolase superfamily protein [Hordeum vulgare]
MHERTATAAATFLAESADKGGGPRGLLRRFIRSRIQGVRVGAKCTVMVYGPTGSGKSHTMFGYARQPDIVYRALRDIHFVGHSVFDVQGRAELRRCLPVCEGRQGDRGSEHGIRMPFLCPQTQC